MKQKLHIGFKFRDIKSLNQSPSDNVFSFKGYASTFSNVDSYNDVILKGAFKECITKINNDKSINDIKILWQHDTSYPIGYITKLKEDDYGLYIEGKILTDLQKGRELFDMMRNKIIDSMSIGFIIKESFMDNKFNIRYISKIDLKEVSFVTFPANKLAKIALSDNIPVDMKKAIKALEKAEKTLRYIQSCGIILGQQRKF
jgi:HK97 family phage prohead protease